MRLDPYSSRASDDVSLSSAEGTRVIWPKNVLDEKRRIDAKMQAVLVDVGACTGLDAKTVSNFQAFYGAWRLFYCNSNTVQNCTDPDYSIWGLGGQMDDCETWEAQLYTWQQFLAPKCASSLPVAPPPTPTADQPDQVGGWLKTAAWCLGILGGLYVLNETHALRMVQGFFDRKAAR